MNQPPQQPNRRRFLRATGVALALPAFESLGQTPAARRDMQQPPKRLLAVCNNLGLLPGNFFPQGSGTEYEASAYLKTLAAHRDDISVFSGVSHPGVDGSHASDVSFLTAAPHPASGGFRNSVSLDQVIASAIGNQTRFPSLTLGVNAKQGRRSLSWTDGGVLIPCEDSASAVYRRLFIQGSRQEVNAQMQRLRLGQSVMDMLTEQTQTLQKRLGSHDKRRLDQYATAIRDVEQRMVEAEQWEARPKPTPDRSLPTDPDNRNQYIEKTRLMYQIARLAFATDSTRAITLLLDSNNSPQITVDGAEITDGYHNLSHHGKSEKKLKQLEAIDQAHMRLLAELFTELSETPSGAGSLMDETTVLYGSNFGDANKHTTDNMPILMAGGGFRHGNHFEFDRENNYPLPNLFVSILQNFGIETDRFASATGTMRGLELRS